MQDLAVHDAMTLDSFRNLVKKVRKVQCKSLLCSVCGLL